jgi:membrane protease YdiL (CAAX protease family)
LIVCTVELALFAILFALAWVASRASLEALWWRWRGGFWIVPAGIGYSIAIRLALGIIMLWGSLLLVATHIVTPQGLQTFVKANRPDVETLVDVAALRENPLYFWLSVTLVSFVVAGLREELWRSALLAGMRNLWPARFSSGAGQFAAVGLAAVLFGLGHLSQGPLGVLVTGLLGLGLGAIMILHRSIWPAVIAHGMFDATSIALLPWATELLKRLPQA